MASSATSTRKPASRPGGHRSTKPSHSSIRRNSRTTGTAGSDYRLSNPALAWHAPVMRIHLQNPDNDPLFDFSRSMWAPPAARSPKPATGHDVSIGVTPADFLTAMREAEALVCDA